MKKYIKYLGVFVFVSILIRNFYLNDNDAMFFDGIRYFLNPFLNAYLLAFQNPNTPLILFFVIIFMCSCFICWIYFEKYIPLKNKLDISIGIAEVVQNAIFSREISSEKALLDIESDEILRPVVLKFKNNRTFPAQEYVLSNAHQLNLDMLETRGFPLKIISALPGYFVGIGLVFTFLGLIAALYFSAQGMKSGSYDGAKDSLMNLLYASSFKFTTSVAGISSSLLISILYKSLLHKLHLKIHKLENIVDEIFNFIKNTTEKSTSTLASYISVKAS